jgi:4-hydroxy-3-methylbut-2-enyl diphosphate reductase
VRTLEIRIAGHAGFCRGVKRAVEMAMQAAQSGPVFALGHLAHNQDLLQRLEEHGVIFVSSLAEAPDGATILIRTHGAAPEVFDEAAKRGMQVLDASCVYVRTLQQLVEELAVKGRQVLIVGEPAHPEVQAAVAWGRGRATVVKEAADVGQLSLTTPPAVVFQTTERRSIANAICEKLRALSPAVEIYDTICQATSQRQEAVRLLAHEVDVVVVIGDRRSANTRRLAEISREAGAVTIELTNANELDSSKLWGAKVVGIAAGASTPDWTIKEVITKMTTEKDVVEGSEQEGTEHSALAESLQRFSAGDEVKGTVVQVSDEEVFVDIGHKSEGVLPRQETNVAPDQLLSAVFQPGQELALLVRKVDEQDGKVILSRRAVEGRQKWEMLENAHREGTILSGTVKEAGASGLVIDMGGGIEAFMPGSMVDVRFIPDFREFVNTEITFKVIELRRERGKVLVSRKQVLEEEAAVKKEQILKTLQVGQIIRGTVRRLTNFGAFVDVGGIDGLVHVSEISWSRVEHPAEALKVGEEIGVKVIELIPERERIGLSVRQAQPDPWTEVAHKFKAGEVVDGKVTRLAGFGAFVELVPGVEGLVHISQMAGHHVKQPSEVAKEGQDVKVKILDINTAAKRISLSMREANPRPKREPVGQQTTEKEPALTLGDVFGDLFNGSKGE